MFTFDLGPEALVEIRFGTSPLCEMGVSLSALKDPGRFPLQLPWLRRTAEGRRHIDQETLLALIDDRHWTPDFLNPRSTSPLTRIEDELETLAAMNPTALVEQIRQLHGRLPARLAGPPGEVVELVVATLTGYWQHCFAPHWTRMRTVLEADIVHRGRETARAGLHTMLNALAPEVSFDGRLLAVVLQSSFEHTEEVGPAGLTLVPTMFPDGVWVSGPGEPGLVMYPARGRATLWERQGGVDPASLVSLLGRPRTRLLVALAEPASVTELAIRFGVTPSAISQHLRVLRATGLLTSARHGRSVLYLRSELGTTLLATNIPGIEI